ncbi:MAG TPA: outer membrane lipoprotein-sorting protein [Chthoniobacterales bacterium]|nr:outer membrane lipoprotein-sorting protein [Chthoniobacterales bacterium]
MPKRPLICLLALAMSSTFAAPFPSATDVLESVRVRQAQQDLELEGEIREGATVVPFRLTQTGPVIRYSFSKPDEALQLRLGDNDSRLEAITRSGVEKITSAQFDHRVRGTSITYEDLSLRFLYWQTGRVTGENMVRTVDCWKLEMKAPSRQSQYSNVWLWVGKENGALMKMEAYDWNAKLLKYFEVVSGQKIEGRWFLKQMRIEERDPGTGKVKTRTYLEINKKA